MLLLRQGRETRQTQRLEVAQRKRKFHPEPITGFGEVDSPSKFVLDIEVSGNQYIGRIDGAERQRISISGFDNGGIALGMFCDSSRCPSFDDFWIEALP
jgi:hypothetical protein